MVSAPDVEALLREHVSHTGCGNGQWWAECLEVHCRWTESGAGGHADAMNAHRAHLAAIITAAYAETLAGVRAEVLREAADEAGCEACGHAPTDGGCPWCHSGVTVAQSGRPSSTRDGACICDYNPETTDGPQEECPFHGRPYEYWVQRGDDMEAELTRLRAVVARVEALGDEWDAEGHGLISNCCSARDVAEGSTQQRCAAGLRAALADPETEA